MHSIILAGALAAFTLLPGVSAFIPPELDAVNVVEELEEVQYVVKAGDHIEKIARQFQILPQQLREANQLARDTIHPGNVLVIPRVEWKSYTGLASWYGPGFYGKRLPSGARYEKDKIFIAHRALPFGMEVKITNLRNGKSLVAPVLDRGPYVKRDGKHTREVDLSHAAARELGMTPYGVVPVWIEPIAVD